MKKLPRAWWKKARIGKEHDGRRKLNEEQKEHIRSLYKKGMGIRAIARKYEGICSRRLIQFVIFPERREHAKKLLAERRKDGRYKPTKEEWRKTMKKHRAKLRLLEENKNKKNDTNNKTPYSNIRNS